MSSRSLLSILLSRNFCLVISLTVCSLLEVISARAQNFNEDNYNYYYNYNNNAGEYLSDWNQNEWGKMSGRSLSSKCVDIPSNLTLCHGIGYTRMLLPNILDHDSLNEVTQQAASWVPLVNINCHPDAKVFLCSLFSPVCLERLIYPC
ncbi:secreted frizzled-related protein 5-like isoform X2, partial [Biomphalaria glabrata]